jgi:von Willebrand factor type A domain
MTVTIQASYAKAPTAAEDGIVGVRVLCDSPIERSIHIGLILDTSGSMEGERIAAVKRTLRVLIDKLKEGDKITVVGFANEARVVLRSHVITSDTKVETIEKACSLVADGGTNMECGIAAIGTGGEKPDAVVLLTDGQVNQGIVSAAGLGSLIRSYLPSVPMYTLGYGDDHNAELLRALSSRTQGTYTYINSELVLPASIGDLLGGLQNEVAKSAKLVFPASWTCLELNPVEGGGYEIGSLIADKPTWVMLKVAAGSGDSKVSVHYTLTNGVTGLCSCDIDESIDRLDVVEQDLRCETAKTLDTVTTMFQNGSVRQAKLHLNITLDLLTNSEAAMRPLVIHMKAQIEEMIEAATRMEFTVPNRRNNRALAMQTTSISANYSAQRGVSGGAAVFSSPRMIQQQTEMVTQYTQNHEDPACTIGSLPG